MGGIVIKLVVQGFNTKYATILTSVSFCEQKIVYGISDGDTFQNFK